MKRQDYYKIVKALVMALEARAYYLKGHSDRVTRYAFLIGKCLKLTRVQLGIIKSIGKLHDLGKIALSDALLNKKGKLTLAEREQINLHPLVGAMILENLGFLQDDICVAKNHHERYDGGGYPDKLTKQSIPLLARIFSVADAFDAMTSDRPYREKMSLKTAVREIARNSGTQFDPIVVKAFLSAVSESDLGIS